ncbi:class I SAM-dependent methyltransferase [Bradyrhizobium sp. U87765 SZCCT0131]|uniref:SAM-dependent methyltransferase n=1 Tax=unclassified Bradyrhizobium TaxID=2631580 RepID=UPI001BA7E95A|nr:MULTISPECIES: cyclopropane-fatty-acyl-phospholipid synthase family protein [unclassified Bradyrhizobium]MBR1220517.1 class I SAM-dependent methyltransferase [Bradyrhizobium sp. U87765 SZCCT0131]MBR1263028.1 class I SAM-dependent methyltransferase [Bradyrhizobium sp. U87765 SZCCT0134]MBR1307089.1 class I SAM-dependent methyltransferase [Bradyrhizobium sp. U87765 SZCCT0110]MBR1323023.1 class I SAM-dependent methyltransferase [Bradyrhizobium sp. U87765 SZCCT0109]MBR1346043.1 class I SAM-depend
MSSLLKLVLNKFIRRGSLTVISADGSRFTCGDGTGFPAAIRFVTREAERRLILDPELAFGEIYMDGQLTVEHGSIADVLAIALDQPDMVPRWAKLQWLTRYILRHVQQFNPRSRSRRNIAHHYDLDGRLYSLFLDADKQYSCAYFESPDATLDDAQLAKKRHIAAKLVLARGQRVLDIGSGWGGLGLYLAEMAGADVTGVTLSEEQLAISNARATEKKLAQQARFLLQDYRDIPGPFDRIVSVGMFEHVGLDYYDRFFKRCAELLSDDGVMLLHSIGRSEGPGITNPWIAKYIFPGGYIPALSEVLPAIERAGLLVTDIEILRLHYAETLKAWRERFLARREEAEQLYDARFVRMWEFYLAASEMSFRKQNNMVFQIQLTKRQGVVPITRDYILREEARLRAVEGNRGPKLQLAGE